MSFAAKAVVFDLDGVLADSTAAVERSWQLWAKRHGVDAQRAVAIGHGRTTIDAIRIIAPDVDAAASFAEMESFEESQIDSVVPINGAPQFVARAIELKVPWGVATSGTRRIAIPRLQRARIPEPPVLVTADDITRGKPNPEPYERTAAALGVAPWECIVFEDAPAGMLAARRSGARVIGICADDTATYSDANARDFADLDMDKAYDDRCSVRINASHYRCSCCSCHTLRTHAGGEVCPLCLWVDGESAGLGQAHEHVADFGVAYAPSDRRFAPARHPILGPNGEYAVDRVALRARAYREFLAFGAGKDDRAHLPQRLQTLLAAVASSDRLYVTT